MALIWKTWFRHDYYLRMNLLCVGRISSHLSEWTFFRKHKWYIKEKKVYHKSDTRSTDVNLLINKAKILFSKHFNNTFILTVKYTI